MSELTFEQKARALNALCLSFKLSPAYSGKGWCAAVDRVYRKSKHFIQSSNGFGDTPEEATDALWAYYVTDMADGEVVGVGDANRRYVLWNGFMWADVEEPK